MEAHGREQTQAQIADLEVMPRVAVEYRGTTLYEMDIDAILTRRPDLVLVDEYAHTNAPGSPSEKRWQDVESLLDAGIEVISTLNVQHLESLNDVITEITGTTQREAVRSASWLARYSGRLVTYRQQITQRCGARRTIRTPTCDEFTWVTSVAS